MTRRRRLRKRKEPRVRPAPDKKKASSADARASEPPPAEAAGPFARKPLKPIGREALKALRDKIKAGKYPSDAAVVGGLLRMLKKPE